MKAPADLSGERRRRAAAECPRTATIYIVEQDRDAVSSAVNQRIAARLAAERQRPGPVEREHRQAETEAIRGACDAVADEPPRRSLRPLALFVIGAWVLVFGAVFAWHLIAGWLA